ncbi:esterase family protein [Granulosicoccus sp.]|nr:alpha/beta hydrolase-fold protein [Granulosicoccus sp.]MDB4224678.1 esterase family protein [Granulosicoccus sp.]
MTQNKILILVLLTLSACSSSPGVTVATDPIAVVPLNLGESLNSDESSNSGSEQHPTTEDNLEPELITQLNVTHRSGQTFILWPEINRTAHYNIYRHDQPISEDNLYNATLLNNRWGSLGPDTSVNRHATDGIPSTFVVGDLLPPLSTNTGMFVYTIPEGESAQSYYAVTSIINGQENTQIVPSENSLTAPIQERSDSPSPVLTTSTNGGKGRVYTQYMDYHNWNPTLNGYAYSYAVTLPFNYNPSIAYPLMLRLHAFGDGYRFLSETPYESQHIQVSPSDPGPAQNTIHTWWYGFSANHNYKTDGNIPSSGNIENFTEQRVLAAVRDVISNSDFNVNDDLVHIVGNSMGASGALSLGLRYPKVFSGVYASQPMTNYAASPGFQSNFVQIWGEQDSNLPIVNSGPESNSIRNYDISGDLKTGVWDWMNHLKQLTRRTSDQFAYLMIDHGKADSTIDWNTQGRPLPRALTDAKVGFSANAYEGVGHTWLGFSAVVSSMFGLGYGEEALWRYPNSLSFPAISNASGSSTLDTDTKADSAYNMNLEWSTLNNAFHETIVDSFSQYQISIRSTNTAQTANITPRNTQTFSPNPNQLCNWSVISNYNDQLLQTGTAMTDTSGIITIEDVEILTGLGSRITIDC